LERNLYKLLHVVNIPKFSLIFRSHLPLVRSGFETACAVTTFDIIRSAQIPHILATKLPPALRPHRIYGVFRARRMCLVAANVVPFLLNEI